MFTQEEVIKYLHYDKDTGVFTRRFSKKKSRIGDVAGCDNGRGYITLYVCGKHLLAHRVAWLYEYGYWPENRLDHINRVKSDNRIANLREVSGQCNVRNQGLSITNKSGVKGVRFDRSRDLWLANVVVNGAHRFLIRTDCFIEAVAHRYAAEQCLDWSDCDSRSMASIKIKEYIDSNKAI